MNYPQILILSLLTSGIAVASSSEPPNKLPNKSPELPQNQAPEKAKPSMKQPPSSKNQPPLKGEYLISFEPQVSDDERKKLFKEVDVKELEKVGTSPLYLILIEGEDSRSKIETLKVSKGVRYVEANFSFQILDKSSDK